MLLGTLVLVWLGTPVATPLAGQPMPTLDLKPLLNSEAAPSVEDLRGKLVLLHFWGTWCPPCQREFPEFAKLAKKFESDSRISIVSVSCSGGPEYNLDELKAETESFLSATAPNMATYCDPVAMTRTQFAMLFDGGTFSYPTTVLVDAEGKIAKVLGGYREGEMQKLQKQIETMLGARTISPAEPAT